MSDVEVPVVTEPVEETPPEPPKRVVPPLKSRFLFVDVAAERAKQLRRGARPRVEGPMHKLERVAMREVAQGFIEWNLPQFKGAPAEMP
jgi:DNA-directed RNA polymerase omega subunit